MTWLYTLDPTARATIRVPFDVTTRRIDWDAAEPRREPDSKVRDDDPPQQQQRVIRCTVCDRTKLSCRVGFCRVCGGWMVYDAPETA